MEEVFKLKLQRRDPDIELEVLNEAFEGALRIKSRVRQIEFVTNAWYRELTFDDRIDLLFRVFFEPRVRELTRSARLRPGSPGITGHSTPGIDAEIRGGTELVSSPSH